MAFTLLTQGSFQSAGVPVNIELQSSADYFTAFNQTQAATTQTTGRGFKFDWYSNPSMASNSAYEWFKTNSTNAVNMNLVTTGGFTYYTAYPQPEAPFVGTAITAASPAVASGFTGLPYNNGDRVVIYNTVGMAQVGGMAVTVFNASPSTTGFTMPGLPAGGFSAAATAVTARRIAPFNQVIPQFLYVTAITQAAQGQVTVSTAATTGTYTSGGTTITGTGLIYVGQKLVFQIPSSFGMVQLDTNNLPGTQDLPVIVTSIVDAFNFTININTTNFTAFAFPVSTLSPTAALFATCAPAGSSTQFNPALQTYTGYDISRAPFRSSISAQTPYMNLQSGAQSPAGSSGDIIVWQCWKAETTQYYSGV